MKCKEFKGLLCSFLADCKIFSQFFSCKRNGYNWSFYSSKEIDTSEKLARRFYLGDGFFSSLSFLEQHFSDEAIFVLDFFFWRGTDSH